MEEILKAIAPVLGMLFYGLLFEILGRRHASVVKQVRASTGSLNAMS